MYLQDTDKSVFNYRVDSRIFPEGANSPLVFPKGGQPANQMGNGVFLKKTLPTPPSSLKKHCRPTLHPLKKLSPHLRKNRAGVVLRRWPVLFTPQPQ